MRAAIDRLTANVRKPPLAWMPGLRGWALLLLLGWACALAQRLPAAEIASPAAPADDPEYQRLVEKDDAAMREIETWMASETNNPAGLPPALVASRKMRIQQQLVEVEKAYRDFLEQHPKHVRARLAYASFLTEQDRDEDALKQLESARDLEPKNPVVWNNLGNYYGLNSPTTHAFACYKRAIELNPREPLYHYNYAKNLHLFRQQAAAFYHTNVAGILALSQQHFRQAMEYSPSNFAYASDFAQTYYAIVLPLSGDHAKDLAAAEKLSNESLAAWQAAAALAKGDESKEQGVLLHLARIQISIGRTNEARANLGKVTRSEYADTKAELEKRLAKP